MLKLRVHNSIVNPASGLWKHSSDLTWSLKEAIQGLSYNGTINSVNLCKERNNETLLITPVNHWGNPHKTQFQSSQTKTSSWNPNKDENNIHQLWLDHRLEKLWVLNYFKLPGPVPKKRRAYSETVDISMCDSPANQERITCKKHILLCYFCIYKVPEFIKK